MPPSIPSPNLIIPLAPLTEEAFSTFGTVVQNPEHTITTTASDESGTSKETFRAKKPAIEANQGSALKYQDVSHLSNFYGRAISRKPARAIMTMFVCKPRKLHTVRRKAGGSGVMTEQVDGRASMERYFDVGILERHPYTPQTFIPMGLDASDAKTKFLVIVAPTLPPSQSSSSPFPHPSHDPSRSAPSDPDTLHPEAPWPQGPGLPDLHNLKAFVADGSQAVTYGPGTWHAPMVVLGERAVDFVVVQFANGVGEEDCQEVILEGSSSSSHSGGEGNGGIRVLVDILPEPVKARL